MVWNDGTWCEMIAVVQLLRREAPVMLECECTRAEFAAPEIEQAAAAD